MAKGWVPLSAVDAAFTIRTVRAVPRGAELCLNYLATTGDPLGVRQATLFHGWQFHCNCRLCTIQAPAPTPVRRTGPRTSRIASTPDTPA